MDILQHIREQIKRDNYEFSLHAEQEREDEHIFVEELEQSVASGELLEDYPDDPRGHSCLIVGIHTGRSGDTQRLGAAAGRASAGHNRVYPIAPQVG
jgi:hypothetical protein